MLCSKCGKREATTHIDREVNDIKTSFDLCPQCAAEIKSEFLTNFNIGNLWGKMFTGEAAKQIGRQEDKCTFCGGTFGDMVETGKAGCSHCYLTFYDKLLPSVQRMQGKVNHAGKIPYSVQAEPVPEKSEKEKLEEQMKLAVEKQDYEKAAKIRDRIKALEGGADNA